jgi:ADP-heptose:LPS heptosyltransferase
VTSTSSSGRLATKFSKSTFKLFGNENDHLMSNENDFQHIAKNPVINFRECMAHLGYKINENAIPGLDIKLSKQELIEGQKTLNDLVSNQKETICLFTFATGGKCYSKSWWSKFYKNLKKEFKNYNIIEVLPVENISQIGFNAPSFYSKDIREICAFIANTKVFIGADSGIMHLASASFTPTIGLFSVTDQNKYHPYNNHSLAFNTNNKGITECFEVLNKIL